MDFVDILREKAFLGREFLSWLWFKSDKSGGIIEVPGKTSVQLYFLDRMTLDLADVDSPQVVSLKGEQSELREGLAALKEGKKIEEARVSVKTGDNDYIMVLKGTWFSFGALRTPVVMPPEDTDPDDAAEGAFLEKVFLIDEATEAVDSLFAHFLSIRVSPAWETEELPAMRRWIAEGAG